jgi:hypothetical protein
MTTLVQESTVKNLYEMQVPDMLQYPAGKNLRVIGVCPSTAEIRTVGVRQTGTSDFHFETTLARDQLLSSAIKTIYSIPFTLKLAAWPAEGVTEDNFIKEVFAGCENLTLAQQGLAQGIASQELRFNDSPLPIISDVDQMTNVTSPYWDRDAVMSEIQASVPDRFIDISSYAATSGVSFVDCWGNKSYTSISPDNDNPFSSKIPLGYNSRAPMWRFVSANQAALTVEVVCSFWSFLHFSIGTLVQNEVALAGISKVSLGIRTDSNLANKIFIRKTNAITSITQNFADQTNTKAMMVLRILTPPGFITEKMYDKETGMLRPYSVSMPLFQHSRFMNYPCGSKKSTTFSHDGYNLSSIPRSIIIALNRDRGVSPLDKTVAFGLINQLRVSINSTITEFPNLHAVINAAMTAGYQELDQAGMLMKGFSVRLPCDSLLSLPPDSAVGKAGNYTLSVSGSFFNQSDSAQDYTLSITIVNEAELQFYGDRFALASGVLIPRELFENKEFLADLYNRNMTRLNVLGGAAGAGIFGDAARWIRKNGVSLIKTAWNNRDKIAQTVGDVVGTVKMLRGGEVGGQRAYSNVSGGSRGIPVLGAGSVRSTVFK